MAPFEKPRRRRYHLTPAGRAALSASAQKNRPWEHSTGPRTFEGKLVSRQNAHKHAYYCRNQIFEEAPAYRALVRSLNRQLNPTTKPPIGPPIMGD